MLAIGPLQIESWTLLGRLPVGLLLLALALSVGRRAGWRRGALALSGACAGLALGVAVVPSVLGAIAGMLLVGGLTLRLTGAPGPGSLQVAASLLAVVGVGRFGCLLNGCCFGLPTRRPWGLAYPPGSRPAHFHELVDLIDPGQASLPVHPVQAYEGLATVLLLAALPWLSRRLRSGRAAALAAAAGYLALRAAVDPLRAMVNTTWSVVPVGPLSAFQWAALAAAAAFGGLAWLASRRAAGAEAEAPPVEAEPSSARLGLPWAAHVLLAWLGLPGLGSFMAAWVLGSLVVAGALIGRRLLAGAEGRTPLRWLAVATAALALVPVGLRAGDGAEAEAARRWVYAPALRGEPVAPQPAPPPAEGGVPTAAATNAVPGEGAKMVRIGDQDTPAPVLAERARALAPTTIRRVHAHVALGTGEYQRENKGCSGQTTSYDDLDRRTAGGGIDLEEEIRWTDDAGGDHHRTWQVRGRYQGDRWHDRNTTEATAGSPSVTTDQGSGSGSRWTAGGLYQWDGPHGAVGLGGSLGRDDSRDSLGPMFTKRGRLVLHPGLYLRAGGPVAGFETGTMALHRPGESPFLGVYMGPEQTRLRVGWYFPYVHTDGTATLNADLQLHRGPVSVGFNVGFVGPHTDLGLRLGWDLP